VASDPRRIKSGSAAQFGLATLKYSAAPTRLLALGKLRITDNPARESSRKIEDMGRPVTRSKSNRPNAIIPTVVPSMANRSQIPVMSSLNGRHFFCKEYQIRSDSFADS